MQIFGQNIFGIFDTQEGVYSGELAVLLHRLINAQLYVTSDNRLSGSGLAIAINTETSQAASSADNSRHGASIFIE